MSNLAADFIIGLMMFVAIMIFFGLEIRNILKEQMK